MTVSHIIDGLTAIAVAWIVHRQERVRRAVESTNGSLEAKVDAIRENLRDNPGPPSGPPP